MTSRGCHPDASTAAAAAMVTVVVGTRDGYVPPEGLWLLQMVVLGETSSRPLACRR